MPAFNSHSPETQRTDAHTRFPCMPPFMQAHMNPIQATVSASRTHIFFTAPIYSTQLPLLLQLVVHTALPRCLIVFLLPAVSYSTQEHGQRWAPVDVSRTTDCTNMRSQSVHLHEATRGDRADIYAGCASPLPLLHIRSDQICLIVDPAFFDSFLLFLCFLTFRWTHQVKYVTKKSLQSFWYPNRLKQIKTNQFNTTCFFSFEYKRMKKN